MLRFVCGIMLPMRWLFRAFLLKMSTVSNCAEAFTLYNVQKYTKVCNFQNTDWWALRAGLVVLRTWLVG